MLRKFTVRTLNKASAFVISGILLGTVFTTPSKAMDVDKPLKHAYHVTKLETYADFFEGRLPSTIPSLKKGDIILQNVGYGMLHSVLEVTIANTEAPLFTKHEKFITAIKEINEKDYTLLKEKRELSSRTELVKEGEKDLFARLDNANAAGIYIVPITSRYDGPEGRSRTEQELDDLGYKWENWHQLPPFQDRKKAIILDEEKENQERYGIYRYRNGITYSIEGPSNPDEKGVPHKTGAILGLFKILQQEVETLHSAIYFIDREREINKTINDLSLHKIALPVPLYLFKYTQPKAFRTTENFEEFYRHRLKDRFQEYRSQFQEAFFSEK
jgi:hypothetical protein